MDYAIEIDGLTKDYETGFWKKKSVRALEGLTLVVKPGQIFGFLGGNGAGKTTTIKLLMGLIFPTAGSARILGRGISDVAMHREIGYCPENPYFYDYLSPNELLDHFGRLFGLLPAERKERTAELLERVRLDQTNWNKQLRKFSKGMLQRVALAQALINDPTIVFMDEPMSGLDPIGRREVRDLIADLRTKGKTVFMSTHILSDVEALCDEVAILNHGRLAAVGTLDELLSMSASAPSFEVSFRGVPGAALERFGRVTIQPGIFSVIVSDESVIERVLNAGHESGGRLISVQQVRRPLEDLFDSEPERA